MRPPEGRFSSRERVRSVLIGAAAAQVLADRLQASGVTVGREFPPECFGEGDEWDRAETR